MNKIYFCCSLLCAWTIQLARPQTPGSSLIDIQDIICRSIPGLNEGQIDLCKEVPKAISILKKTQELFNEECTWQFRKELWNCSGVGMPIFSRLTLRGERGFAIVVFYFP